MKANSACLHPDQVTPEKEKINCADEGGKGRHKRESDLDLIQGLASPIQGLGFVWGKNGSSISILTHSSVSLNLA